MQANLMETHAKNPDLAKLRELIGGAAKGTAKMKASPNRIVTGDAADALAETVFGTDNGVSVACGGTKASSYPATTIIVAAGWYTRGDGVKCVRVVAGFVKLDSPDADPVGWMQQRFSTTGITFYSDSLRELAEFLDVPTGEPDYDAIRASVVKQPDDMSAWATLAKALDERGHVSEAAKVRKRAVGVA